MCSAPEISNRQRKNNPANFDPGILSSILPRVNKDFVSDGVLNLCPRRVNARALRGSCYSSAVITTARVGVSGQIGCQPAGQINDAQRTIPSDRPGDRDTFTRSRFVRPACPSRRPSRALVLRLRAPRDERDASKVRTLYCLISGRSEKCLPPARATCSRK